MACEFVQSRVFRSIKLRREIPCNKSILTSPVVKLTMLEMKTIFFCQLHVIETIITLLQ